MPKSHAAAWGKDAPTPAQLKEFFAQVEAGRITHERLQAFLRGGPWFFSLILTGEKASVLITRGNYLWVNDAITDERFPIVPHAPEPRTIELVAYGHIISSEEVLEDFVRRGLERPIHEDPFQFGIAYPEKQRKCPIVFLHKPVRGPSGYPGILVLRGDTDGRCVDLDLFGGMFGSDCLFAGVSR